MEGLYKFVSQILYARGVSQAVYSRQDQGWWHKKNGSTHTYSYSWIRSDAFCRYMGVTFTTKGYHEFSVNIQRGDVTAMDYTSDGDYEHCGFVAGKRSCALAHSNGYYYNFLVAQHTRNYLSWAGDKDCDDRGSDA